MRYLDGGLLFFERKGLHYQFAELPDLHTHDGDPFGKKYLHHNFNVEFIGAQESIEHEKLNASNYHHNFLLGNDPSKWAKGVKDYKRLVYNELYPGIDLEYYLYNGNLKYDFHISAGSSPDQIKFKYDGGVDLEISEGKLVIKHELGEISTMEPFAYQVIDGEKVEVACNFSLRNRTVSYDFPEGYRTDLPLILDPEVIYFTYTGTLQANFGMTATDDSLGNGYTGGTVFGPGYATTPGAYSRTFSGGNVDIAISKFSADGKQLIYGTYIGGNGIESIHSMVIDDSNDSMNLFFLGATSSANYPTTTNAHDTLFDGSSNIRTETNYLFSGGADIVVSKLDSSGSSLLGSTFFGGNGIDGLNSPVNSGNLPYDTLLYNYGDSHRGEIIVDKQGNCIIASSTRSANLTASTNSISGAQDGLIGKFTNSLDSLIWSRYLGGSGHDAIYSIKVLDDNMILVGGGTSSHADFPANTNSYKPTSSGGRSEGFVSVISSDGITVENTTFLGTSGYDQVFFVEFDRFQNIYALGQTTSGTFPLKKVDDIPGFEADTGAGQFIVKLNRQLDSAIFSMTFGDGMGTGTPNISPTAFLVDRCQNVFAAGWGGNLNSGEGPMFLSDSMPITPDAFRKTTDNQDFYFYVLNRDADRVYYATFFGNNNRDHVDGGTSRFDKDGVVYQSLCADCGGFRNNYAPAQSVGVHSFTNLVQTQNRCSNALLKFDMSLSPKAGFSVSAKERCLAPGDTVQIRIKDESFRADQYNWNFFGNIFNGPLPNGDTILVFNSPGIYTIFQEITDTICLLDDSSKITIEIRPDDISLQPTQDTVVCFGDSLLITAGASPTANFYHWSRLPDFSDTVSLDESFYLVLQNGIDTLYLKVGNDITNACEKLDTVLVDHFPINYAAALQEDTICERSSVAMTAAFNNIDRFVWDFDNGQKDSTDQSPLIQYNTPGNYDITLEVENFACKARDTTSLPLVVFINDISLNSIPDTLACRQDTLVLVQNASGTGISRYLWSSDSLFSDTLNNYPSDASINIQQAGIDTFFVKVSNNFCAADDEVRVEIVPFQLELEELPDESCTPFSQELSTTIVNADSFRIYLGDGTSTNSDPTPIVNFNTAGLFNVALVGYNDRCSIKDSVPRPILVYQGVELQYLNDTAVCEGEDISLTILHDNTGQSFFWSLDSNFQNPINNPNDSSVTVNPNATTTYYYQAVNGICDADSFMVVDVSSIDIDLDDFEAICFEDTISLMANVTTDSPPPNYSWSPTSEVISGQGTSTIEISPSNNVDFWLRVIDQNQCRDSAMATVEVSIPRFDDATINSSADTVYKGQSINFTTNRNLNDLTYQWSPSQYFNDPFSSSPTGTFPESSTVYVTITDEQTGCEVIAMKRIGIFEINCSLPDIFVPSAFTPNGDGENDVLYVRGEVIESFELVLYNRWGEEVFKTTSFDLGWDGNYKGKAADPGVFVYHLRARCFDGQDFSTKGNITLIK